MENNHHLQEQQQQQTKQDQSDGNEEMWNLFEENSFFFTDDESIDEDKEDIDVNIDEDEINIGESIAKNEKDIDVSIDENKEDINASIVQDKEDLNFSGFSIDENKDIDNSIVEDNENIAVIFGDDKEATYKSIARNKEAINVSIDEDMEDIDKSIVEDMDESIVEDKEDIDVIIDENTKDIDEIIDEDRNKEAINVSIDEDMEDIDKSIVEDMEDIHESIVEDKEDIDVIIVENTKDIDENIDEDKEEIDVSRVDDKEDIDKSKDEHKGDIDENIDEDKEDIWKLFEELYPDDGRACIFYPLTPPQGEGQPNDKTGQHQEQEGKIIRKRVKRKKIGRIKRRLKIKRMHREDNEKNLTFLLGEILAGGAVNFYMKEIGDVNVPEYECHVEFKGKSYKGDGKSKDAARLNAAEIAVLAIMQNEYDHKRILQKMDSVLKKNLTQVLLDKEHIRYYDSKFFCNICSKSIFSPTSLFDHVNGVIHKLIVQKIIFLEENFSEKNDIYICNLCSVYISNKGKYLLEHVRSMKHKVNANNYLLCDKSIKEKENDFKTNFPLLNKEYIRKEDGKYFCNLCTTSFVSESFCDHVNGKKHELNLKKSLTEEELVIKNALDKGHIKEDVVGKFDCNLCLICVISNEVNCKTLLVHLKGKKHEANVEIDIYWGKEAFKEFLLLNKEYIDKRGNDMYICKIVDCSPSILSPKGLHEHVKQENHILKMELSKGHMKEESLGKYFCNLCSTTLLNTKSLLEHVEGKKHKNNLQLSSKGIFNHTHENDYYKVIEKEVLLSSKTTEENSHSSSMEDKDLKCENIDSNENESNKLHIIEENPPSCEDPIVLEALNLGHLKLDTFGEFTCTLCGVSSTKLETVKLHLKGKKHKLNAKEFTEDQENGASSSVTVFKAIPKGYFINMSGLPETATEHDIMEFFSPVDIRSIRFIVASTEEDLSSHIGEADVEFLSQDDATIAMAKHLSIMEGNIIHLTLISTRVSSKCLQSSLVSNNPASLRLVVTDSQDVSMKIGTVIVLTSDHATIILESRDYKKLKDININDNETVFYVHDTEDLMHQYFMRDHGSTGGTLLNGTLICPQGSHSEFIKVNHDDKIQCGLVTLVCHIHSSSSFCFACEKETKLPAGTSTKSKTVSNKLKESIIDFNRDHPKDVLETSRKKELKAIRKKFGLKFMYNVDQEHVPNNPEYTDRSNKRRKQVGSDNPYEKTEVAHTSLAISNKNKGFKMLAAMGWKEGEGLGKDNSGMVEPIRGDEVKDNRTGLGSMQVGGPSLSFKEKEKLRERQKILDITKGRFYK